MAQDVAVVQVLDARRVEDRPLLCALQRLKVRTCSFSAPNSACNLRQLLLPTRDAVGLAARVN